MFKLWKPHYATAMDESRAVFDIAKILDTLDEEGRKKVLAWLEVHYGIANFVAEFGPRYQSAPD